MLLVLACTGVLATRPRAIRADELLAQLPSGDAAPLRAVVVVQPADCGSALGFLRVYARPELRGRIAVQGLLLGSERQLPEAATALEESGIDLPLRLAPARASHTLSVFGYRATPFVLLIDRAGRVVMTHGPAAGADEQRRLEHALLLAAGA